MQGCQQVEGAASWCGSSSTVLISHMLEGAATVWGGVKHTHRAPPTPKP